MSNKRERPHKDQGEHAQRGDILNDMEKQAQARIKAENRIPITSMLKLDWANKDPNFYYTWASDSPTYAVSLQQMCDAGYTFVRHEHGSQAGERVVKNSKGCSLHLMRQPMEYFKEDEKVKHEKSRRLMSDIKGVGSREYAGSSKEMGKGEVAQFEYTESPDAKSLMEG